MIELFGLTTTANQLCVKAHGLVSSAPYPSENVGDQANPVQAHRMRDESIYEEINDDEFEEDDRVLGIEKIRRKPKKNQFEKRVSPFRAPRRDKRDA